MRVRLILFVSLFVSGLSNNLRAQETTSSTNQPAEFPGGSQRFYDFIQAELKYPTDAKRDSVSGVVYVSFNIDVNGLIDDSSIAIEKSLTSSCDQEAIRILKKSPAWMPARSNGEPASYFITFPVSFILP